MIRWRLRDKMMLLMGGLVVGLLLVTLFLVDRWATHQAHRTVINDLRNTQRVFERFQQARLEWLLSSARILGREYALRNAMATYDQATVLSAGKTYQARVKSDLRSLDEALAFLRSLRRALVAVGMLAIAVALAIRCKVDKLNAEPQGTYAPMVVNIGINSVTAAVGSTRFQGLTGTRWTFTASGPVTNVAARLGELATNGRILLGPETANRVKGYVALKSLGEVQLKNVQEPTLVYEVLTDAASEEA